MKIQPKCGYFPPKDGSIPSIHRLSYELVIKIVEVFLDDLLLSKKSPLFMVRGRQRLMQIDSRIREIILGTQSLWSAIVVHGSMPKKMVEDNLTRSGNGGLKETTTSGKTWESKVDGTGKDYYPTSRKMRPLLLDLS